MFLTKEALLNICQVAEFQWKMFEEFLTLTGSQEEATRQTRIYMTAFMAAGRSSEGDTKSDGQYQ